MENNEFGIDQYPFTDFQQLFYSSKYAAECIQVSQDMLALIAKELGDRYASERLDALVLAGRMALATGLTDLARTSFESAARQRGRGCKPSENPGLDSSGAQRSASKARVGRSFSWHVSKTLE
jgi:hypothetical protein